MLEQVGKRRGAFREIWYELAQRTGQAKEGLLFERCWSAVFEERVVAFGALADSAARYDLAEKNDQRLRDVALGELDLEDVALDLLDDG